PGIAAAEHDVVRFESSTELRDDLANALAPAVIADALASALAGVVLEGSAALVRHVAHLGRLDHSSDDERRAQARAESKEEHAPTAIAADGLHGRIVDDAYRPPECGAEVVAHPSPADVVRLGGGG